MSLPDRRTGPDERRIARPDRMEVIRWEQVDRREHEWRRAHDVPNYRVVARNDRRCFAVPDATEGQA